jgi:hypothetical protein
MTKSRRSKALRKKVGFAVAAVTLAVAVWIAFGARPAQTAPAQRPEVYETAVGGTAGGYELELGAGFAVVYATRKPDGGVSVDCTDQESAAAIVYGARP